MTNREVDAMIRKIDKAMKRVGEERDKIDELIDEMQSLRWDCVSAIEHMQDARDALSGLV